MDWLEIVKDFGFPAFVAIFVLCRLEPAVKKLDASISGLTVIVAKANGMKDVEIAAIVAAVATESKKQRRIFSGIAPKKGKPAS